MWERAEKKVIMFLKSWPKRGNREGSRGEKKTGRGPPWRRFRSIWERFVRASG